MRLALILALATSAQAETILATRYYNSFDHRHPILARIKPGQAVETKTLDASGLDIAGQKKGERGNPLTGPFYVEGAEPGDAIAVHFDRMRLNRNFGWSGARLGLYALAPESIEGLYRRPTKPSAAVPGRDDLFRWNIDLAKNIVRLADPVSVVHKFEFAAKPMLGCVGVAAAGAFAPNSGISGPYGGNMDYNEIGEGATVILPVTHPGALLFIGDGHALQADGEPTGTGIETSMDVTFTVQIRKKGAPDNPRVETATHIISVGSQPEFVSSLDRALRLATSDMASWLMKDYRMEPWAAHMLIGYQGRYDVVTVAGSLALKIPKSALPK